MDSLSPETLEIFAGRIGWAGAEIWARQLPGDHFNRTDRVDLHLGGSERSLLVKRYAPYGGDRGKKASVEFQALSWLNASDVPVPEPVYLDQEGKLFGCPAIATGFVEGRPIYRPEGNQANWAADLARSLAAIHATPCGTQADEFLLDANRETTWFLNGGQVPGFMEKNPDGIRVWRTVADLAVRLDPGHPGLVHVDYWPGNVLWHRGSIAAVIDWEEAAYGDPAIDVAYARMELILNGLNEAADRFTRCYEQAAGRQLKNLPFWELVAAARPMYEPDWAAEVGPQLRHFISRALEAVEREWGQMC